MASEPDLPADSPRQDGISLDELAEAFAQVMGTVPKAKPGEPARSDSRTDALSPDETRPADAGPAEAPPPADAEPAEDDRCPVNPRTILEAMLFVGDREGKPLTAARAAELMRDVAPAEIPGLIAELNRRYAAGRCPYSITSDADGYRMTLQKPFHPLRDRFFGRIREARLSQATVDVLAIVAYQQPLTAEQVGTLRGKPSSHVLSQLVHRGLLRIERQPGAGRVVQYFTTDRFLQLFGLQTLADLPQSEELDRQ